jgi:hypothetical protein
MMMVGRASFHHLAHPLGDDAHCELNLHVVAAADMVVSHCFDFQSILVDWAEVDIEIVVDTVAVEVDVEFADGTAAIEIVVATIGVNMDIDHVSVAVAFDVVAAAMMMMEEVAMLCSSHAHPFLVAVAAEDIVGSKIHHHHQQQQQQQLPPPEGLIHHCQLLNYPHCSFPLPKRYYFFDVANTVVVVVDSVDNCDCSTKVVAVDIVVVVDAAAVAVDEDYHHCRLASSQIVPSPAPHSPTVHHRHHLQCNQQHALPDTDVAVLQEELSKKLNHPAQNQLVHHSCCGR